jgi:prolipoprotein diacylglyceryltransferase
VGVAAAYWLFRRELAARSLPERGADVAVWGVVGGLVGAKLLWTIEHRGEEPLVQLLTSRGGMSWFGSFVGGVLAGSTGRCSRAGSGRATVWICRNPFRPGARMRLGTARPSS